MSRPGSCRTRSGNVQIRQVCSAMHKGRPCQPCILCKQGNQSKYFHPKSWKDPSLFERLRQSEPSLDILPESCICRPCRDDLSKLGNKGHVPRWRKKSSKEICCVPGCTNPSFRVTQVAGKATLEQLFGISSDNEPLSASNEERGYPMCKEHYGELYRHVNPTHFTKKCKMCDKLLPDLTKARKCPQPALVQSFLVQNTEFTGEITASDPLCYACYKSHLVIIKQMHNTTSSRDNELCSLIDALKQQASAYNLADINTIDQTLSYAALFSAIYVGEALLKQSALLLPDVYDSFHDKVLHIIRLRDIACDGLEVKGMVTCNWLQSQLSSLLNHHMAYRCCVKKYGTVLYRHGGDLVHALNVCLGQARSQNHPSDYRDEVPTAENIDFQQNLSECCLVLNSKIHACIDSMVEQDVYQPHSIEDININQFIGNLDPDVWKAVCILTQPIKGADMSNIRKVRCFVCVCVLLYTTNSQCSFPLHTFLTDAIETCGGSSRLIKLFNRLGICTSAC